MTESDYVSLSPTVHNKQQKCASNDKTQAVWSIVGAL